MDFVPDAVSVTKMLIDTTAFGSKFKHYTNIGIVMIPPPMPEEIASVNSTSYIDIMKYSCVSRGRKSLCSQMLSALHCKNCVHSESILHLLLHTF